MIDIELNIGESIEINDEKNNKIEVKLLRRKSNQVWIGINAPKSVYVAREERDQNIRDEIARRDNPADDIYLNGKQ